MVNLRIHRSSYKQDRVNNIMLLGCDEKHEFLNYLTDKNIDESKKVIKFKKVKLYNIKENKMPKENVLEQVNYAVYFFDFNDFKNSAKMCYTYLKKIRYYVQDVVMVACGDYGITQRYQLENSRRFKRSKAGKIWKRTYGDYELTILDEDMDELADFITGICK
jgi:hypothetical protein